MGLHIFAINIMWFISKEEPAMLKRFGESQDQTI
jgi:hypothetical protein